MKRRRRIYEGSGKVLFEGPEPGTLVQYFKDDASHDKRAGVITGKGVLNNRISEHLMTRLGEIGVPTHFLRRLNMREQLVRSCEIIPLEIIVRNVAAGSLSTRLGIEEGTPLPRPIIEFSYKNDDLGDPLVPEDPWTDLPDAVEPPREQHPWRGRHLDPIDPGPRTVVVAGDDAGPPARVLAERAGWPLLAEPSAGCRTGRTPLRTYRLLLASSLAERVVKKPSPVIARSSAEPVCSTGPSAKFWVIESTEAPIPWIMRGLVSAEPATISENSVRLRLKP